MTLNEIKAQIASLGVNNMDWESLSMYAGINDTSFLNTYFTRINFYSFFKYNTSSESFINSHMNDFFGWGDKNYVGTAIAQYQDYLSESMIKKILNKDNDLLCTMLQYQKNITQAIGLNLINTYGNSNRDQWMSLAKNENITFTDAFKTTYFATMLDDTHYSTYELLRAIQFPDSVLISKFINKKKAIDIISCQKLTLTTIQNNINNILATDTDKVTIAANLISYQNVPESFIISSIIPKLTATEWNSVIIRINGIESHSDTLRVFSESFVSSHINANLYQYLNHKTINGFSDTFKLNNYRKFKAYEFWHKDNTFTETFIDQIINKYPMIDTYDLALITLTNTLSATFIEKHIKIIEKLHSDTYWDNEFVSFRAYNNMSYYKALTEAFIDRYIDKFNLQIIFTEKTNLSLNFIKNHINSHSSLTCNIEHLIRLAIKYQDSVDESFLYWLSEHQISKSIVNDFILYKELSDTAINDFKDYINWSLVPLYHIYTSGFATTYADKLKNSRRITTINYNRDVADLYPCKEGADWYLSNFSATQEVPYNDILRAAKRDKVINYVQWFICKSNAMYENYGVASFEKPREALPNLKPYV